MRAAHTEKTVIIKGQEVLLKPGQFIFARRTAARDLGMTERQTRTRIDFLKKAGNLTLKTTRHFTIGTVTNWGTYQGEETSNDPLNDQRPTHDRPRNKNYKNVKKINTCPFEDIRASYNSILGDVLPKCRAVTDTRKRALRARWDEKHLTSDGEHSSNQLAYWDRYFQHVKASSFLTGNNKDSWKPNFDWLIKKSNFVKVIENTYH